MKLRYKILISLIAAIILVIIGVSLGCKLSGGDGKTVAVQAPTINVTERTDVEIIHIEEILESASELVTMKYHYTDVDMYEENIEAFGYTLPFTTDKIVFTYSGVINAGIDLSEIQYTIDNDNRSITLILPPPTIIAHEIDESSFQSYDVRNSIFTSASLDGYTALFAELKAKAETKLAENQEFYPSVTENAEDVLRGMFSAMEITEDYRILFEEAPAVTTTALITSSPAETTVTETVQ